MTFLKPKLITSGQSQQTEYLPSYEPIRTRGENMQREIICNQCQGRENM